MLILVLLIVVLNIVSQTLGEEEKIALDPDVLSEIKTVRFTVESWDHNGTPCMTDCVDGVCMTGWNTVARCVLGWREAATYYTSQKRYDKTRCLSKCGTFGYDYRWCIVDSDLSWDFCNSDTERRLELRAFTDSNGPCANKCDYYGKDYRWCNTYFLDPTWDKCDPTEYLYDFIRTSKGTACRGVCDKHDGEKYFWCVGDHQDTELCAPLAVYYSECPSCKDQLAVANPGLYRFPNETVLQYAQRMECDASCVTITVNDPANPIFQYTYRPAANANTPLLPLVVRARIERRHIRPANSRGSEAISREARNNCRLMGMNTNRPDGNNDAIGHLISFKNGGPSDIYNFAPQNTRLNLGLVNVGHINAPSIWAASEREMTDWVTRGHGYVTLVVVAVYDGTTTRPIAFGTSDVYYRTNGQIAIECPSYWFSNDPNEDPDCYNG